MLYLQHMALLCYHKIIVLLWVSGIGRPSIWYKLKMQEVILLSNEKVGIYSHEPEDVGEHGNR